MHVGENRLLDKTRINPKSRDNEGCLPAIPREVVHSAQDLYLKTDLKNNLKILLPIEANIYRSKKRKLFGED